MRRLCLLVMLLAMASPAFAQTHPCDITPTPNPILSGPVKAQWCSDGKGPSGAPSPVTLVKVFLDGNATPTWTGAPVQVTSTANAAGFKLYESALFTVPKGTHVITVVQSNSTGDGIPSLPFSFGLQDELPGTVIQLRVVK
jgi:hypothetical protein